VPENYGLPVKKLKGETLEELFSEKQIKNGNIIGVMQPCPGDLMDATTQRMHPITGYYRFLHPLR